MAWEYIKKNGQKFWEILEEIIGKRKEHQAQADTNYLLFNITNSWLYSYKYHS